MGCEVKSGMEERQTKSAERKEACRRLKQLAAARGNDAVKLAFLQPEQWQEIDGMDLTALKEFKRSPNGVVEIKLLDRVEILQKLMEWSGQSGGGGAEMPSLLKAMGLCCGDGAGEGA